MKDAPRYKILLHNSLEHLAICYHLIEGGTSYGIFYDTQARKCINVAQALKKTVGAMMNLHV